jgi:hypothetical protein
MTRRNYDDWLTAFVEHASIGEAPLDVLWWVGVSTIAGALRRRVWIEQATFQWVPNFYIVAVAPPGIISKTTTANVGFRLLRSVEGINFGPDVMSWQALIQYMGTIGEEFETLGGGHYEMSACTCAIDEYGTFIDPFDRQQVDNLTSLWDGKAGTIWKATKTQGHDKLSYPWLNIFACTTPNWLETNFPEAFLGSGFMSRHIFVFATEKRQLVAYPGEMSDEKVREYNTQKNRLIADLTDIAAYSGPYRITPDAIKWGTEWYARHWDIYGKESRERLGFPARKQTHLHKLAMVISAARGDFPAITRDHLIEANERLEAVEPGIKKVLTLVGTTNITRAGREIIEFMELEGKATLKRDLYGKYFFRRLSISEFEEALQGAVGAGYVGESSDRTVLTLKKRLET